jgi:acyl-CoA thioester hydrolase
MGHLNVRHYFAHANHGIARLALELGLTPSRLRAEGLALHARDQHVRFIRELRSGSYFTVHAGVLAIDAQRLQVYEEMRVASSSVVAASMLTEVALVDAASGDERKLDERALARAGALTTEVTPEHAPRGIERSAPRTPPTLEQAIELGLIGAYLAPVQPEDCDAQGRLHEAAFMARVSDGMGHFFQTLRAPRASGVGGAALEYRFVFHERPRLGDIIEVRSGLKSVGNKTMQVCHWVFDVESGRCTATSEAVAVSFDLTTRKAIAIPADARAELEARIVAGLSV